MGFKEDVSWAMSKEGNPVRGQRNWSLCEVGRREPVGEVERRGHLGEVRRGRPLGEVERKETSDAVRRAKALN